MSVSEGSDDALPSVTPLPELALEFDEAGVTVRAVREETKEVVALGHIPISREQFDAWREDLGAFVDELVGEEKVRRDGAEKFDDLFAFLQSQLRKRYGNTPLYIPYRLFCKRQYRPFPSLDGVSDQKELFMRIAIGFEAYFADLVRLWNLYHRKEDE